MNAPTELPAVADALSESEILEVVAGHGDMIERLFSLALQHEKDLEAGRLAEKVEAVARDLKNVQGNLGSAEQRLRHLDGQVYRESKRSQPIVPSNFAERIADLETKTTLAGGNLADWFRGDLQSDSVWNRGEVWRWHGSLFVALRPGSGTKEWPTASNRGGRDPGWLGLVGFGSPAPGGGSLPQDAESFVAPPSSPTSPGIAGQVSYSGGYAFICVATNQWRRFSTSGTF